MIFNMNDYSSNIIYHNNQGRLSLEAILRCVIGESIFHQTWRFSVANYEVKFITEKDQ